MLELTTALVVMTALCLSIRQLRGYGVIGVGLLTLLYPLAVLVLAAVIALITVVGVGCGVLRFTYLKELRIALSRFV